MEKPTWLSTQLFKFRLNRLLKKLNHPDISGYEELVLMCDIINLMYGYIDCDDKELDTTLYAETNYELITRFNAIYDQLSEFIHLIDIVKRGKRIMTSDFRALPEEIKIPAEDYFVTEGRFAFRHALRLLWVIANNFMRSHASSLLTYDDKELAYSNTNKLVGRLVNLINPMLITITRVAEFRVGRFESIKYNK
jgi:hypothetical protein